MVPFPLAVKLAVCPHVIVVPDAVGNGYAFTVTVTGTNALEHDGIIGVITIEPCPAFTPCKLIWFVPVL